MRLTTTPLLSSGKNLIGRGGIDAVFPGKLLNRFTLLFQPGLGLNNKVNPFKSLHGKTVLTLPLLTKYFRAEKKVGVANRIK